MEWVLTTKRTPPRNTARVLAKVNARSIARLLRLLQDGGMDTQDLAEISGLHKSTVCEHIRAYRAQGVVYIETWGQDVRGSYTLPVYRLGVGVDAKKPKPLTPAQRSAAYRERVRQRATKLPPFSKLVGDIKTFTRFNPFKEE